MNLGVIIVKLICGFVLQICNANLRLCGVNIKRYSFHLID